MPAQLTIQATSPQPLNTIRFRNCCNWLLKRLNVQDYRVSIALVDDAEIAKLNERYRQKPKPTNVLSFPSGFSTEIPFEILPVKELGDIVISLETAAREAREYGQTFAFRMRWLLIHGLLHLLGYDHERGPKDEEDMQKKEQELLAEIMMLRRRGMTKLAINVDHVSTVRQARGITEPDPVAAAAICELAGATGIVVHLREDRRHIQDRDVRLLRQTIKTKLNLEMGANDEIIDIALDIKPDLVTLVPEKRQELTTEGGLDVLSQKGRLEDVIGRMTEAGIPVSIFADPDFAQLEASKAIGATFVELHTGRYSDSTTEAERSKEYALIAESAAAASELGLRVCAGHGLNYQNTADIAAIDSIEELSIGHAIIARAIFTGLDQAVREMLDLVRQGDLLI